MPRNRKTMYSFIILHNGREVENLVIDLYETEAEARAVAEDALDLCCPPGSPSRRFYRYQITREAIEPEPRRDFHRSPCNTGDYLNDHLNDYLNDCPRD